MALKGGNHIANYKFRSQKEDQFRTHKGWSTLSRKKYYHKHVMVEYTIASDYNDRNGDYHGTQWIKNRHYGYVVKVTSSSIVVSNSEGKKEFEAYDSVTIFDTSADMVSHKLLNS